MKLFNRLERMRCRPGQMSRAFAQGFGYTLLFLLLGAAASAQEQRLRLEIPGSQLAVGAPIEIGILPVDAEAGLDGATVTDVRFNTTDPNWHITEDWRQPDSSGEAEEGRLWTARVQPFALGELTLPGVEAVLRNPDGSTEVIELEAPTLQVVDGLDESDTELRDLHDIQPYRLDWRWIAAWAAAGALATAAALLLVRRALRQQEVSRPGPPPVPPGQWALGEIERRRALPECRDGHSKIIASEASDVIRHFIERQFGFPALEMTTHECVGRLESTRVPAGFPRSVKLFLEECDLAKFTRVDLEAHRKEALWDDARRLVETVVLESRRDPDKAESNHEAEVSIP